jgi:hypothetical protein
MVTKSDDESSLAPLAQSGEGRTDTPNGEQGEQARDPDHTESPSKPESSPSVTLSDEDRDAALDAAEFVCEICQTTSHVHKFANPYWVVRCVSHNPRTYHGGVL